MVKGPNSRMVVYMETFGIPGFGSCGIHLALAHARFLLSSQLGPVAFRHWRKVAWAVWCSCCFRFSLLPETLNPKP